MRSDESQDPRDRRVEVSLAPDPVIDAYKAGIDRTLLEKNLSLTVEERLDNLKALQEFALELRKAGARMRAAANHA